MSRLDPTVIVNRRTFFRAVAGLAVALVLVGGSLAGLSEDVLDFRDWSGPSVEDRGGSVGLAAVPRRFPEARVGPVPAPSDGLTDISRGPAGRARAERRVADRPADRPRRRRARPPRAPAPASQPVSVPAPAAAPAPAPTPAPALAPAPVQVAAAPAPPPRAPAAAPTRPVGRSGKVKQAHKRVQEAEPVVQVQTRTGAVATPVAPAPVSAPGKGPDGQGAPGHRKASSPGRGKHDRNNHGLGDVRASRVRGR